jgi:glycosyltransferase involved in cell wall biosynthesis
MFASDLTRALVSDGLDQHVAVLRPDRSELSYPAETTDLSRGWRLPGLRVDGGAVRDLRRLIGRWAPDVVQVHGGEPLKHVLLASGGSKGRVIYRRIGPAPAEIARGARRMAHARLMRRADAIVAVADVLRQEAILSFRIPADRVVTIRNAVDPSRLVPTQSRATIRAELGIPTDARLVTSIGALTPEKDPLTHIEVVRRASRFVPKLFHLVVGDGPLRAKVDAAASGNGPRLMVAGSRPDVDELLGATDVVLLASLSEGLPGCLIEAGMLGVPTAAFAVGGVPEIVLDGRTGVLAPPGDVAALAERLAGMLNDPIRVESLAAAARERTRSLFDIRDVAPRYRQLYEDVVR